MAKKKGKREEGFTFPEFDKEEFRQKELKDSKVILFAVFYAFTMAVISYYLVRMTSLERSVMIFGFIAPFGLIKILPLLFDTSDFERKNWFGPMFMSFLAWLGLFILFSNPPFNDISNPEFGVNEIYVEEDGNWNLTTEINSGEPFIFIVSVAFSSMGLLLGQLADTWDNLSTMQNFFLTPLSFLGGIFY